VDVNAESSPLPPANRDGRIDQDWAGDDQDWWDWYVTLAENDDALWVPRTSSTSPDQAIFVDQATDASVPSDAVLLKVDRFG